MASRTVTVPPVPAELFAFWKQTQGKGVPTAAMLGMDHPMWAFLKANWMLILGGALGGAVLVKGYRHYKTKRAMRDFGEAKTLSMNPSREGWGQTISIKSGDFHLHPMIPEGRYRALRALNMRQANKFRVTSAGKNLGELHKSAGKRRWKAISYAGPEKYGNSRSALLGWLKHQAPLEAAEYVAGLEMNKAPCKNCR
jgi:hypothetical protein